MFENKKLILFFFLVLTSCATNKYNNVFVTDKNYFYVDKKLNIVSKISNTNVLNTTSNQLVNQNKNHKILLEFKSNSFYVDSLQITDTTNYVYNLLKNKCCEINKTAGFAQDFADDTYKYSNYSYTLKNKMFNETFISTTDGVLCLKSANSLKSNLDFFKNTILNLEKFATRNSFFRNRFVDDNEFLINDIFISFNNVDSLSLEKNTSEISSLINNYNKQGNYKAANKLINKFYHNKTFSLKEVYQVDDFQIQDINLFSNTIKDCDIVLINDHHLFESSRYSASLFLTELKKYGFNYFAGETFAINENDLDFNIKDSNVNGFYLRQPTYGLMTLHAYLNNFIICGYDSSSTICNSAILTNQQCRDSVQANNISKIFNHDSKAKIIIFGGHGHINKTKNNSFTPMGYYLQKILPNKRIISINQSSLISGFNNQNSVYKILLDSLKIKHPYVIKSEKHFDKINDGTHDAYVIQPNQEPFEYWYYKKNKICTKKIKLHLPKDSYYIEIVPTVFLDTNISVFKSTIKHLYKNYVFLPETYYLIKYYNSSHQLLSSSTF